MNKVITEVSTGLPCSGAGVEIQADGVRLNCNSYDIIGQGLAEPEKMTGTGIAISGKNTIIENCHVKGFANGIYIGSSSNTIGYTNMVTDFVTGVYISGAGATKNTISSVTIAEGDRGIVLGYAASENKIYGNIIYHTYREGIGLYGGSNNQLVKNRISGTGYPSNEAYAGIYLSSSNNNLIANNTNHDSIFGPIRGKGIEISAGYSPAIATNNYGCGNTINGTRDYISSPSCWPCFPYYVQNGNHLNQWQSQTAQYCPGAKAGFEEPCDGNYPPCDTTQNLYCSKKDPNTGQTIAEPHCCIRTTEELQWWNSAYDMCVEADACAQNEWVGIPIFNPLGISANKQLACCSFDSSYVWRDISVY